MNVRKLKKALFDKTNCRIQHNGWTCGTCFFGSLEGMTNQHWQAVLLARGDNKREELNNLPADIDKAISEVMEACKA